MLTSGGAQFETAGGLAFSLRAATEEDYEELVRVYASERAAELDQVTWWDDAQKLEFCRSQYAAQKNEYDSRFPDAEYDVISVEGRTAGRIWVGRGEKEIRLLDIVLLPEFREQGIGAVLVGALIEEARSAGKRLRHMVFVMNEDARRFYERLGFRVFEEVGGGYLHMEWKQDEVMNEE